MGILEFFADIVTDFVRIFSSPALRIFPLYIFSMTVIAYVIYRKKNIGRKFFAWLFPSDIYFHKSHFIDIKLFLLGCILRLVGFFNIVALSAVFATLTMNAIGGTTATDATMHPLLIGLILLLANDFAVYWTHRIHHETAPLWPFHSVHHSAEVLTPVTVFRKHPIYDVISSIIKSVLVGFTQGVLIGVFVGKIEFTLIAGVNAFYVLFHLMGSNLRHSHVWLSYGYFLEHILISPAQHQIHHSQAKRHWNKNYGEIFAFWDWMFGTLYVPASEEKLEFGIADENGPVPQRHNTLSEAIMVPINDSWQALRTQEKQLEQDTKTSR